MTDGEDRRPGRSFLALAFALVAVVLTFAIAGPAAPPARSPSAPLHPAPATPAPSLGEAPPIDPALFAPPPLDPIPWQDVRWERVADPGNILGGPLLQDLRRVVRGGIGIVALGSDSRGEPGSFHRVTTVWLSRTGRDWAEVELNAGVKPGDVAEAWQIAAGPAGIIVIGSVCCREEAPAIWWSATGERWARLPIDPGLLRDGGVLDLAAGPGGYVAVGSQAERAAIWASGDGRSWARVSRAEDPAFGPGLVSGVVWTGRDWIAVGRQGGDPTYDGAVWRSPDLTAWRRVAVADPALAGDDEVSLWAAIPFAGGVLARGGRGTHQDRVKCEDLLGGAGTLPELQLVLSCGWEVETHWWSVDGEVWQRLPDVTPRLGQPPLPRVGPPPGRRLIFQRAVASGGPGLVTVDYELVGDNDSADTQALWTSADGRTWTRVGNAEHFGRDEWVEDVLVAGRTVIAVGEAPERTGEFGKDGAVWIGTILP
jgi:hypothetical protein